MKQTILFSNVLGDISSKNEDCSFNQNLINAIQNSNCNDKNLVFINAPGFENDDLYFNKILNCFKKIDFHFDNNMIHFSCFLCTIQYLPTKSTN